MILYDPKDTSTHVGYTKQIELCTCRKKPHIRDNDTRITSCCFSAQDMHPACALKIHKIDCEFMQWFYTFCKSEPGLAITPFPEDKGQEIEKLIHKIRIQELTEFDDNGEIEDEEDLFFQET